MIHQRGFSLIEALIALVVLSIGLIGVAAMQLKALQSATAGYQRSVATLAAVDAQERLWAELAQLTNGNDCTVIQGSDIEEDWRSHWFAGSQTPIRHFSGDIVDSSDPNLGTCEFRVEINLEQNPGDIDPEIFTYTFRLPQL